MNGEELHRKVMQLRANEMRVRDAAARGEPMPKWVCLRPEARQLELYYWHERKYCAPRNIGEAPF